MVEPLKDILFKAFKDTIHFFGWKPRMLIYPISLFMGFLFYGYNTQWNYAMNELKLWLDIIFYPIAGLTIFLFFWNIICTPYRLSKERESQYKNKFERDHDRVNILEKEIISLKTPLLEIEHDEYDFKYYPRLCVNAVFI